MKLEYIKLCIRDFLNKENSITNNKEHIKAAINWLMHAQDITKDGGISAFYSLRHGWAPSYPETTGYIIPTMFDCFHFTRDEDCRKRAIRMSDWLINIQSENGSFQGFGTKTPIIFDIGQILKGLCRAHIETNDRECLNAAIKAGEFLVKNQDKDGAWRKSTYNNIFHTYHTRVAWALLELFLITKDIKYEKAANKNLKFVLSNQKKNGWFQNCAFDLKSNPFTHTIAYTVRGILESAILLRNKNYLNSALKTADALLNLFNTHGFLAGSYNERWGSRDTYSCLTGDAQTSIIWLKIFEITKNMKYLVSARKMNRYLKTTQNLNSRDKAINGGIKGSQPVYGKYFQFSFPNWSAKFFIDALLLEIKIEKRNGTFRA
ncbi:MAG: terpene cyclase/mutase family protein [Candidatus Bathyarchaeota archaeon]|nr:terpene cyclase/mutase family protein [Candidatus Bathyarchaeota archaeon]